jgi:GT2 family glycosyltransferase
LWIPYEVFEKVGLFDEVSFPQAGADYDFTLRASRAGYKIYCNFDATLYSHVYASSDWEYRLNFSLKNYLRHLMGFKGGGNLKVFIKFTMRHCPPRYRLQQIIKGTITRLGGYPWRWLKHILKLRGTCDKLPNLSERS